ncbi:MAG: hypothetical protein J6X53_01295, partial [Abditibacteriota bacterium]|nr:hypothetical protein [Abditibacteriota bacterium]
MRLSKIFVAAAAFALLAASAFCDEVLQGTLTVVSDTGYIKMDVKGDTYVISPAAGCKMHRAEAGKSLKAATLKDFAKGDTVVALVGEDGRALSLKAYYSIITGVFKNVDENNNVSFADGRIFNASKYADVIFPTGAGVMSDLQSGMKL